MTKTTNPSIQTLKTILHFFKIFKFETPLIVFILFLASLAEIFGLSSLLVFLLDYFNQNYGGDNYLLEKFKYFFNLIGIDLNIRVIIFIFSVSIFLRAILIFISMYFSAYVCQDYISLLRKKFLNVLVKSNYKFVLDQSIGEIVTHFDRDTERYGSFYNKLCSSINYISQSLMYMFFSIIIDWKVTFFLIFFCLILGLIIGLLNKQLYLISSQNVKLRESLSGKLVNFFSSFKPFKAMAKEKFINIHVNSDVKKINKNWKNFHFIQSILTALQEPFLIGFIFAFIIFNIYFFQVPIINVLLVSLAFYRLSSRILNSYMDFRSMIQYQSSINRLNDIIKSASKEKEKAKGKKIINFNKEITFHNVTYSHKDNLILKRTNLRLPKNKLIFIQGKSGIGKTTFVDLIAKLYRPDSGYIKIDDNFLDKLNLYNWRKKIGYVTQDTSLFDDTILNNITLLKKIKKEDITKVLDLALCSGFIKKMKNGLNTKIGAAGTKLSGGQRQRISIARALLQKPEILVLDESTSELNKTLENKVFKNLKKFNKKMLIIIISHNNKLKDISDISYKLSNYKFERT